MISPTIRPALLLAFSAVFATAAVQSTTALISSANPVVYGHSVTLTANVTPIAGTGSVTFFDGATIVGVSQMIQGKASITTSLLQSGVRSIKAFYSGDNNTVASTSTILLQSVTPIPGNGFQPVANLQGLDASAFTAVADFNGDGRADLAVLNINPETGNLIILIGNGDGTFKQPRSYKVGVGAVALGVADLNGDGHPDIAVLDNQLSNVSIFLGFGDGTFNTAGIFPTAIGPTTLAIAELNGDGIGDIVVGTPNGITVLIGQGGASFQPGIFYGVGLVSAIAIGDLNRDGNNDLVISNPNGVSVMLGFGNGAFLASVNYPTGVGGGPVVVADFNGDGRLDIAASTSNSVSISLGNGNGTFQKAIVSVSGASNAFLQTLALGDFNGDGKVDLAAVNFSGTPSGTNVSVLLSNGDGTFQAPATYNAGLVNFATVGDINGDGVADIVTVSLGAMGILIGTPAPVVTPPPPPPPTPPVVASGGVLNAASFAKDAAGKGTAVAPGSLVSIFGTFTDAVQASAATVPFGNSLGGVSVTFNNIPAPIRDVIPSANEINAQLPFGVATSTSVNVVVTIGGLSSAPVAVPITAAAPGIFTIPPTGLGNAVLVFTDPTDTLIKIAAPASSSAAIGLATGPVPRGTAAFFYATGLGAMSPSVPDGSGGSDVTHFASFPIVTVGGFPASVQFAGQAPGFPGVNQINIIVPNGAPTGNAIPLQVKSADGAVLSNVATIAVR